MKITICIMFIILLISCSNYREYKPVLFDGNELVEKPNSLNQEQTKNLIEVLNYYKVDYKLIDGKIHLRNNLDKELIWNYTTKANDSLWLLNH